MNESTFKKHLMTKRIKRILDLIYDKGYQKIEIVKQNGKVMYVKATKWIQGSFSDKDISEVTNKIDYGKVITSIEGGKKITIKIEESYKV